MEILKVTSNRNSALKQHFTDAKPINDLMCHLLGSVEACTLLEPSVGYGAFLNGMVGKPSAVDVVDVDSYAIDFVKSKFEHLNIKAFQDDFIDIFVAGLVNSTHPVRRTLYDCVISNPPYGLYLEPKYRKQIKRAFPTLYARESYRLFFTFAVSQLRVGGRYVFLLPDTFLSSVNHRPLRRFMCSTAAPTHIIRFPSKMFETVNFGYANLCIVVGERRELKEHNEVKWLDVFEKERALSISALDNSNILQGTVLIKNADIGWSSAMCVSGHEGSGKWRNLGDVAECRTGIYTGDNKRFLGYDSQSVKGRRNGHPINWMSQVHVGELTETQKERGLVGKRHYVPLVRGGHRGPFEPTMWAVDWSPEAIDHYRIDKKARLQNSRFYFRSGISVPMVTTRRISAALISSNEVFDQGVVGVFPHKTAETNAILIYLNSSLASLKMKTIVNGSANNSANYMKRLPIPVFSDFDLESADQMIYCAKLNGSLPISACDEFVSRLLNIPTNPDNQ